MTDTADKLMALADRYASRHAYAVVTRSLTGESNASGAMQSRAELESAIREALDLGEPVAFISAAWLKALPRGELAGMSKLPFQDAQPLYARSKT